jgi:hypothetical protein
MRSRALRVLVATSVLGVTVAIASCSDDEAGPGSSSSTSSTGGGGTGGSGQGGSTFVTSTSTGGGEGGSSCAVPCESGEICSHGTCVPQQTCSSDDDCSFDTTCVGTTCVPWDDVDPGFDETCVDVVPPGLLSPSVRCEFSTAPAGDPFPNHVDVQGTPIVARFFASANEGPPSIAASFTATVVNSYTEDLGVIRVLRGTDCTLEANLGGVDLDNDTIVDWTVSSASLAAGDLDGDGVAEIVAYGADGSTLAFTKKNGVWGLLWKAPRPASAPWAACNTTNRRCSLGWAGPSIHDLDGDAVPEVIREGVVFSAAGALRSGPPTGYASYSQGLFPVLANLDADPAIELSNGARLWSWDGATSAWLDEPGFSAGAPGHVAVANFGAYGAGPATDAEIVIVQGGTVRVRALDGSDVMPSVVVPGVNPGGGAPTISDFDGDGLPEVGVAGRAYYTVYDIDCGPTPRPGGACVAGSCDFAAGGVCPTQGYILWSRSTQDLSSNVTGSSIFDFEADGSSEVVYGDECFVRVYNGESGEVLFSQYRSSCTWYENPIIADVDGNFRADLVTPSNKACSPDGTGIVCQTLNADGVDPQWNGVRCEANADCASGVCDEGLCRCTASAECCAAGTDADCIEAGLQCAPPNAGTPGTGNTCRASHPHGVSGIRVYADVNDRWVRSRTIWNQHAYHVTHVNEDGTIPSSSQWQKNWLSPDLNNFRQNVPGTPNGNAVPDSTAGAATFPLCAANVAELRVDVCNRGSAPVGAGLVVGFYVDATQVCETTTTSALAPGECAPVTCLWSSPPTNEAAAVDVDVVVNDGGGVTECKGGNNVGVIEGVFCTPPS